jgi:hypothetical protein
MTSVENMTDEQFDRLALEILQRELGPDGLARLLRLNRSGRGGYTRERMQWQKDMTVDQVVASISKHRGTQAGLFRRE